MQALDQRVNDLGDAYAASLPGICGICGYHRVFRPFLGWLPAPRRATCTASEKTSIAYRENGRERPGNGETHPKDRSVQVGRGGGREREAAGGG